VKTIKLSNASRPLTEYAAELGDEVLVLTERNRPVAAVVPLKGVDLESLALSSHPEFLELIARSRAQIQRGQTLTLDEMKKAFSADRSPNKTYLDSSVKKRHVGVSSSQKSPDPGSRRRRRRR
jgi:antitoxin (DNA-binding transcriptional repressor) of toxin-antitoxin stability system